MKPQIWQESTGVCCVCEQEGNDCGRSPFGSMTSSSACFSVHVLFALKVFWSDMLSEKLHSIHIYSLQHMFTQAE